MIGLGKLGLPCLLAMESFGGHEIYGYDVSLEVIQNIGNRQVTYWEEGVNDLLGTSNIQLTSTIEELYSKCEIIFVAVQTPHDPLYEGRTPTPDERKDFDYSFLKSAISELAHASSKHDNNPLIVVISTVLPGTMRTHVLPILSNSNSQCRFAYNPYFIAMGTTIYDFMNPEFILIGLNDSSEQDFLANFYSFVHAPIEFQKIESAELTKVAYNTFIGFKIVFSNALAEITDKVGGDVDEVTNALSKANRRIMSSAYMRAGMGDGGGCHPRDQIAMSWLAQTTEISVDVFDFIAKARDSQTLRQANFIVQFAKEKNLPICLLGMSYKPDSPLDIGSPARLLAFYIQKLNINLLTHDPYIEPNTAMPLKPHVFFISSRHSDYKVLSLPEGSFLIDPWAHNEKTNVPKILLGRISRGS